MCTYVSFNVYPRVLNVYGILGADMNANYQIIRTEKDTLLNSVIKNKGMVYSFFIFTFNIDLFMAFSFEHRNVRLNMLLNMLH
jgi:hypothetical protein